MNIVNKEKLENLLLANWPTFLDHKSLLELTTTYIQNNNSYFKELSTPPKKLQNNKIHISRFSLVKNGFLIWLEFYVHVQEYVYTGTSEFLLGGTEFKHIQTIGHKFR